LETQRPGLKLGDIELPMELTKLQTMYNESSKLEKANFLVIGRSGCGKTHSLRTAPAPILIDSFDYGGPIPLHDEIQKGRVFVDRSYETEFAPKGSFGETQAYKLWEQNYNRRRREGVFEKIRTYVIDSGTNLFQAILNEILRQEKRNRGEAQLQDYNKHKIFVTDTLNSILSLPCNVIITGHIEAVQDKKTEELFYSIFTIGQQVKTIIPLNIDELYVLKSKEASKGIESEFLMTSFGKIECRSRLMGRAGVFKRTMPANYSEVLKMAGIPHEDGFAYRGK